MYASSHLGFPFFPTFKLFGKREIFLKFPGIPKLHGIPGFGKISREKFPGINISSIFPNFMDFLVNLILICYCFSHDCVKWIKTGNRKVKTSSVRLCRRDSKKRKCCMMHSNAYDFYTIFQNFTRLRD